MLLTQLDVKIITRKQGADKLETRVLRRFKKGFFDGYNTSDLIAKWYRQLVWKTRLPQGKKGDVSSNLI